MTSAPLTAPEVVPQQLDDQIDLLETRFAPDQCSALGWLAVRYDLIRAVFLVHEELGHESRGLHEANETIGAELQYTRDRIAAIGRHFRTVIGTRIIQEAIPEFLLSSLGVKHRSQIFDRLLETEEDGTYTVADETLMNLLQWHNYQMAASKERFLEIKWEYFKESFKNRLRESAKEGWLPHSAIEDDRLSLLGLTNITVDDGMSLHEANCNAYTWCKGDSVAEICFPRFVLQKTVYHEQLHVIVGVDQPEKGNRFGRGVQHRGLYRLFPEEHRQGAGRVLDEAVTEHITLSMYGVHPNPNVIDPEIKGNGLSCYVEERELLDALCNGGKKRIDIRLFIKAYFEDSTLRHRPAIKRLNRKLKKAFPGRDVLTELGEIMSLGEYEQARKSLTEFTQSLTA